MTLCKKTSIQDVMAELKKDFVELEIDMENIVSITTDDAPSIIGKNVGFVKLLKQKLKRDLVKFHCIVREGTLCAKSLNHL